MAWELGEARCLFIPIKDSDEAVSISADQMPDDVEEVLDVFRGEIAPLDTWLDFAVEYYRQDKLEPFLEIVKQGSSAEIAEFYQDSQLERVAILATHAAHFLSVAQQARQGSTEHANALSSAEELYEQAEKINTASESVFLGKGFLLFAKGQYDDAYKNFNFAREYKGDQDESIPAILGMAAVSFNKGKYQTALDFYTRVLKLDPECPANVRLGMALCLMQLNQPRAARQALERVLELEPEHVEALVQLGVLDINMGQVAAGYQRMAKAYALDPHNAVALVTLADYFFYNQDMDKALQLASRALDLTRSSKIAAAAHCRIAQIAHHKEDMETAFGEYTKAAKKEPEGVRPLFGLAQCHIWRNQLGFAVQCLEKVLELAPRSWEPKRLLGILYSRIEKPQLKKSLQLLKQVLEVQPDDTDTLIEICQLQVQQHIAEAKSALDKLKQVPSENIPAEFWNNLGAMLHKLGEPKEALDAYRKAIPPETLNEDDTLALEASQLAQMPERVTVLYNLARCWEELKDKSKAHDMYQKLLDGQPLYIDAYLRLCELDSDDKWLHTALEKEPKHAVARLQLGTLALNRREWSAAQKQFDECMKNDKNDMYALLSLGNVYLHSWKDEKALNRALDLYLRVIKKQPHNAFATHGIACVLAEKGWFVEAKEMLDMIHESKVDSPDVFVNLGHVNLQLGNLKAATKAYEKALKFGETHGMTASSDDNSIRLHLARCLLSSKDFEGAIEVLQGAKEADLLVKFNTAVVMHAHTKLVFSAAEPDEGDAQAAFEHVKTAKAKFGELLAPTQEHEGKEGVKRLLFSSDDVKTFVTKCQLLEDSWSSVKVKAEARRLKREEGWRIQAEKAAVLRAERLKEQQEKDALIKAEQEKRDLLAQEDQKEFEDKKAAWEQQREQEMRAEQEKQEQKQKRKKKEEQLEVVEELPAYGSGEEEPEAEMSSDDEKEGAEEYPSLFGEEDDDAGAAPEASPPKKKRLVKKRPRDDEGSGEDEGATAEEDAASGDDGSEGAAGEAATAEPERKRGKRQMLNSDDDE